MKAKLEYSSRFVKPIILSIMENVVTDTGAILKTRVIRSSKNKTKILSEYEIPTKHINSKEKDLTSKALARLNKLFDSKPLDVVLS